uniref:Uncharacterized protein n=1 Tax=Anguilla anguilla TaxID=7936 RepID=A0A0E9Q6M9_ANGAN
MIFTNIGYVGEVYSYYMLQRNGQGGMLYSLAPFSTLLIFLSSLSAALYSLNFRRNSGSSFSLFLLASLTHFL